MIAPASIPGAFIRPAHGGFPDVRVRVSAEMTDALAYLARKRANAEAMASRSPEFADEARWTTRQIEVFSGDLRAGFHHGAAFAAAVLAESEE